jgi:DNA-binding IclR family transcriptional regulator
MKKTDYTSSCQQRILKVMLVMFGHEIDGLPPGQIAKLAQITPQAATRDLFNLVEAGIAEQVAHNNNYRLTPMLGRKALAILHAVERAAQRVDETRNRYTRTN